MLLDVDVEVLVVVEVELVLVLVELEVEVLVDVQVNPDKPAFANKNSAIINVHIPLQKLVCCLYQMRLLHGHIALILLKQALQ